MIQVQKFGFDPKQFMIMVLILGLYAFSERAVKIEFLKIKKASKKIKELTKFGAS